MSEATATKVMKSSLTFSWSKPTCEFYDGPITGYTFKLTDTQSGVVIWLSDTTANSVTIANLVPYTEYSFQVAATTNMGPATDSDIITVRTAEAGRSPKLCVKPMISFKREMKIISVVITLGRRACNRSLHLCDHMT